MIEQIKNLIGESAGHVLGDRVPGLRGARPNYLKIKDSGTLVGYDLDIDGTHKRGYLRFTLDPSTSEEMYRKALRVLPRTNRESGVVRIESLNAVLFLFPYDYLMRRLRSATSLQKLKRSLIEVPSLKADRIRGQRSEITVERYKPERKIVQSAHLRVLRKGVESTERVFLRHWASPVARRVHETSLLLREAGLRVATPIGTTPEGSILLESAVEGPNVETAIPSGETLADAVIDLHRRGPITVLPESPLPWAASALAGLRRLEAVAPDLKASIRRLSAAVAGWEPDTGRASFMHGDLHLGQIIETPEGLVFVDLERSAVSDPLIDVASLEASIIHRSLTEHQHRERPDQVAQDFRDTYLRQQDTSVPDYPIFLAVGLMRRALIEARSLGPAWAERASILLEHALEAAQDFQREAGPKRNAVIPDVISPHPKHPWSAVKRIGEKSAYGYWNSGEFISVEPPEDPEMTALQHLLQDGVLTSYRFGRRAVVHKRDEWIKICPPSKAPARFKRLELGRKIVRQAGFETAELIRFSHDHGAITHRSLEGTSLHSHLMDRSVETSHMRVLGERLARLHTLNLDSDSWEVPIAQDMDLAFLCGVAKTQAPDFSRPLTNTFRGLPHPLMGRQLVHGDLHDKNVWITPRGVGLIDLEGFGLGSGMAEISNLTAHLMLRGLQRESSVDREIADLLTGYEEGIELVGEQFDRSLARNLFRLACLYCFRSKWIHLVPRLLMAAKAYSRQTGDDILTVDVASL